MNTSTTMKRIRGHYKRDDTRYTLRRSAYNATAHRLYRESGGQIGWPDDVIEDLFKQWGAWLPPFQDGAIVNGDQILNASNEYARVGKRAAGHLLDGQTWREMPEVSRAGG